MPEMEISVYLTDTKGPYLSEKVTKTLKWSG